MSSNVNATQTLHQLVVFKIAIQAVGKSCHCGQEFTLLVGDVYVAIRQFAVVKHLAAFGREGITQLAGLHEGDGIGDAQGEDAMAVGYGSKGEVGQRVENAALTYPSPIEVTFRNGELRPSHAGGLQE